MDIKEIGRENAEWINVTPKVQWQAQENTTSSLGTMRGGTFHY
jgi:hypothetical protein